MNTDKDNADERRSTRLAGSQRRPFGLHGASISVQVKAKIAMKLIRIFSVTLLFCATAIAQPAPAPQQWGTTLGRVVYDGKPPKQVMMPTLDKLESTNGPKEVPDESLVVGKNGGLANVFVYLRSKPSAIHPDFIQAEPKKILFEAKNARYIPHGLGIWTQDILDYHNREAYGISPSFQSASQGFMVWLDRDQKKEMKFQKSENVPSSFMSNTHPWMQAKLLVRDNPYFCVTNERGNFCIPNLPANEELEFVFWHERVGYLKNLKSDVASFTTNEKGRLQTKLTQPVSDLGEFKIDPTVFKE